MKKKRGLACGIQEFKKDVILTPIFVIGEVAFDVLIPMIMAKLLDLGVNAGNVGNIWRYGILLVVMALVALAFGACPAALRRGRPPGFPATCAGKCIETCSSFPFPTSTNFPPPASSHA